MFKFNWQKNESIIHAAAIMTFWPLTVKNNESARLIMRTGPVSQIS